MEQIRNSLLLFNTSALFFMSMKELKMNYSENIEIQKASIAILNIALTQYFISSWLSMRRSQKEIAEEIRYVDWLLTTPLLLFTYHKLAVNKGYKNKDFKPLLVSVVLMVILGFVAEANNNDITLFIVSCLPYLYILYEIKNIQTFFKENGLYKHSNLGNFFIYGWVIYPSAFFMQNDVKYIMYNIGDFLNKAVYSSELYKLL